MFSFRGFVLIVHDCRRVLTDHCLFEKFGGFALKMEELVCLEEMAIEAINECLDIDIIDIFDGFLRGFDCYNLIISLSGMMGTEEENPLKHLIS